MNDEQREPDKAGPYRNIPMPYRSHGRSGLHTSALGMSLRRCFGNDQSVAAMRSLLTCAVDSGITHFDTAPDYGPPYGAAEENLGLLVSRLSCQRDELVISTRAGLGTLPGPFAGFSSRKRLLSSLDASLRRTGLDYIDVFYAHRHDPFTPLEETMGALDSAVRQGKALYVGLSGYAPALVRKGAAILRRLGTPLVTCKLSYSMRNRWPEHGLLDVLEAEGIGCVAEEPLELDVDPASVGPGLDEFLRDEIEAARRRLAAVATARGQTPAQCAISWILRNECMASVLTNPAGPSDLAEYQLAVENLDFTDAELAAIEACFPDPDSF
ncbi:aldo/keto reductase [Streptomyces pathocidini]|uniref:Aldo/keto reductase n=2 Tax=Streptomyces pathocidini TaxID=1650571 RepID=A0ABW7UXI7_9ACTN